MSQNHDWRQLALKDDGRILIEASAGTGKTWTIGVLYLRLLLECSLNPRHIIVATFTQAAAAELKERLRKRIENSLHLATTWPPEETSGSMGSDLLWLHHRWQDEATRSRDMQALTLALNELDIAPIGTLHSLCSRILSEHPFAAGAPFRNPEMVNADQLHQQLADDLWRILHAPSDTHDPQHTALREAARPVLNTLNRNELYGMVSTLLKPAVEVAPATAPLADSERLHWQQHLAGLVERSGVFKTSKSALLSRWRELAEALKQPLDAWDMAKLKALPDALEGIDLEKQFRIDIQDDRQIQTGLVINSKLIAALRAAYTSTHLRFYSILQQHARKMLEARLSKNHQLGFDEVLQRVRDSLHRGPRNLADTLFAQWPVAMIDEFQDTDPIQFDILDAIYRNSEGRERGRLLLIGDPKQAIYRFRGGDIHTYLRACKTIPQSHRLTLDTNHRSAHAYISAMNAFYQCVGETLSRAPEPSDIAYLPVNAHAQAGDIRLTRQGQAAETLRFFHDSAESPGDETTALLSCASHLADLLDPANDWQIDGRPLQGSDLCVLLPKNAQAEQLTTYLRQRGITAVNRSRANVFSTDTAYELFCLLNAVQHCQSPQHLRAAAATRLWGLGYHDLRRLKQQPAAWQALVEQFHQWQQLWQKRGVLAVVAALLQRSAPRQLGLSDGERVLTDLRHLGELLQEEERQSDGPTTLLARFSQYIREDAANEDAADSRALRLESDAKCVQVMTLHASKGLEFNLVLLPLMFANTGSAYLPPRALHSQPDGRRLLVMDKPAIEQVAWEEQEERFRLLYVALTRARLATHVWLPSPNKTYKRIPPSMPPLALYLEALPAMQANSPFVQEASWPDIHTNSPTTAQASNTASQGKARPMPPPRTGALPSRHSFSSLAHNHNSGPDTAAQDEIGMDGEHLAAAVPAESAPAPALTRAAALDALHAVAGADFGQAVHDILEHRRIGQPLREQPLLIREKLDQHAVRHPQLEPDSFIEQLALRLDATLEADLDAHGLRLAALPASALRCEMAFHYQLDGASLSRLQHTCAKAGEASLIPPRQGQLLGLMTGKIDLIFQHQGRFHVLDWKSNRLGPADQAHLENYSPAALEIAMDASAYRFQALLYTVALERYLIQRLGSYYQRNTHLGDAWYLFVRATGLHLPDGTACGIWHQRFSDAVLDAAQQELATTRPRNQGTQP